MLNPNTLLKNGRYRIVRQIGEGGFGVVYEAQDLRQDKKVALKELGVNDPEFRTDLSQELRDKVRYTFETEAQRLIKLHHTALPIAYDYLKEGDRQYLVMEYIEGPNLKELLKQRKGQPFGLKEVLGWADQLLDVLVYLHAQTPPLIHRDIKPENIILKPDGKIMLLDFGIAKGGLSQYSASTALPASHTPGYAPPEQGNGGTDERSDLYALGATLYQLLTNKRPIVAKYRQKGNDPLSFNNLVKNNPQIPADIVKVLAHAMALDPNKRPSSAKQMRKILQSALENLNLVDSKKTRQDVPIPFPKPKPLPDPIPEPNPQDNSINQKNSKTHSSWKLWLASVIAGLLIIFSIIFVTSSENSIFSLAPTLAFTPTPNAIAHIEQGDALRNEGKYEQAIAAYAKAIDLDPNNADAYFGRAFSHGKRSELDLAIADYTNAIRLNPNYVNAYNNRGIAYRNQGQPDLAIGDYTEAIRLDRDYTDAYYNRGNVYSDQEKLNLAIADYDQAISLNPDYALAYRNRGNAYRKQEKLDLAIADYDDAIRINPDYAEAYNGRGITYRNKEELDLAIADYDQAIRINPDYAVAYYNRGNVYSDKEKLDLAIADYNDAIRIDPEYALAYRNRGNAYRKQEKLDLAITDYSDAIRLDPDYADAYYNRGLAYEQKGEQDLAITNYRKALELGDERARANLERLGVEP